MTMRSFQVGIGGDLADTHVVLSGSERPRKHDAERVSDVDPASPIEVTVTLRGPELPQVSPGQSMSREELECGAGGRGRAHAV
jgi:hypothetical protein